MKHFEPNRRFCGTASWRLVSKSLIDRPPLTASALPTLREEPNGRRPHRVKEENSSLPLLFLSPEGVCH